MSLSTSTSSSSLTRYRPAILLLTALAASYTIYYVQSSFWSSSSPPTQQSLVRRNAVHRRRHRRRNEQQSTSSGRQRLISAETALELYRSSNLHRSIRISILDSELQIALSPASRPSAAELAERFELNEGQGIALAKRVDLLLLEAVLASTIPLRAKLIDPRGPGAFVEAFQQEGFSDTSINAAVEHFNAGSLDNHDARRVVQDTEANHESSTNSSDLVPSQMETEGNEPSLPRLDGVDSEQPELGVAELPGTAIDGESLHSWHGGDENDEAKREGGQSLLSLLYHIAEDQARKDGYVHRGVSCNSCNIQPIRGIRYRCANCIDFDLCEQCEAMQIHPKTHVFYKVRIPAPFTSNARHMQPVWYPGKPAGLPQNLPRETNKQLCKETGLEAAEVDALWDQFKCLAATEWIEDPYELGIAIDRQTFDKCFTPHSGTAFSRPNLIHDRMFALYDSNSDGLIGFEEFLVGLSSIKSKNQTEKLKKVFQGYDLDRDGYVSRKDMLRMFRAFYALSKELTREVIASLEEDNMEIGGQRDLVASSQPISSAFTGTIPEGDLSRVGEGKSMDINGDFTPNFDSTVVHEDNGDEGDYHQVVGDAGERSIFGRVGGGVIVPGAPHGDPSSNQDIAMEVVRLEGRLADYSTEIEFDELTNQYSNRQHEHPSRRPGRPQSADGGLLTQESSSSEPEGITLSRNAEHGLATLADDRAENESSDEPVDRRVEDHIIALEIQKLKKSIRQQNIDERWRRRHLFIAEEDGVSAPSISEIRTGNVISAGESEPPVDPIKARISAIELIRSSASFRSFRLSIQDEMSRRHWDVGDEGETLAIADLLIRMAGLKYDPKVMASDLEHIGEVDDASDFIDWFVRNIHATEKEIKEQPAFADNGQSRRSLKRSRSSSKVRFEDDLNDGEIETRSNTSVSSRSIPVGERWGAYEVPEPEKDLGREYLYQTTQEGLNELLDPIFRQREDLGMEVLRTAEERSSFRQYITRWSTPRKLQLVEIQIRKFQELWRNSEATRTLAFQVPSVGDILREIIVQERETHSAEYIANVSNMLNCGMQLSHSAKAEEVKQKIIEFMDWQQDPEGSTKDPAHAPKQDSAVSSQALGFTAKLDTEERAQPIDVVNADLSDIISTDKSPESDFPRAAMELHDTFTIFNKADPEFELDILQKPLEDLLQQSGYALAEEASSTHEQVDPTLPQHRPSKVVDSASPNIHSPSLAKSNNATPDSAKCIDADRSMTPKSSSKHQQDGNVPNAEINYHDPKFQDNLKLLAMMDFIEKEDEERGGPGRISFEEFVETMEGPRGENLAFIPSWIHMATFWGSSI